MANELQLIADMLKSIKLTLESLPTELKLSAKQVFATELSAITSNAGLLTAGEIRTGNGKDPGSGFTGVRMSYPPMLYSGDLYPFASVNTDVLQVGISLTNGKLYAGQGAVVIDSDGITVGQGTGVYNKIKFGNITDSSKIGYIFGRLDAVTGGAILGVDAESFDLDNPAKLVLRAYGGAGGGGYSHAEAYVELKDGDVVIQSSNNSIRLGEGPDGNDGIDISLTFDGYSNVGVITWMEDEAHIKLNSALLVGGDTAGEASTVALTNVVSGVSTGAGSIKMNGTTARDSTGWLKIMSGTTAKYVPLFDTITG